MLVLEFKSAQYRELYSFCLVHWVSLFQYVFSDVKKPYLNCCLSLFCFRAREFFIIESMAFSFFFEKCKKETKNRQTNGKENGEKKGKW